MKYEETVIENRTIPQTVYKTFRNDVSMLINDKLIVMIEHQSTINENMPFRLLEYVSRIYEGYVQSRKRYSEKMIMLPTPEFYVFYNGIRKYPDEKILKLSDSFTQYYSEDKMFPQLELTVRIINIGPGQTLKFQNSCAILKQYCDFIEMTRSVPCTEESYLQVINDSIEKGVLSEYLRKNSTEVINMLLAEYDYETDISVKCEDARAEGIELGIKRGIEQGIEQLSKKMLSSGLPLEKIMEITGLTENKLQELSK